ncbi:MAG: hypothetical protein M3068_00845 [Gemmatimonadota bacterium]|nr:hypothetical protein [Gemmatimonadota bacterium]
MTIDDERFEALLRQVGTEYNSPPTTPKDVMWDRIAAERRQRQMVVPITRRRWLWSTAAAAMLLIGIGIGRMSMPGARPTGEARVASSANAPAEAGRLASGKSEQDERPDRSAYHLAALEHLTQAEALIVSFRAETKSGELNADVQAWSRDLLTTTRLLMDSPAANDRAMRKLLEDLELVLAQISQLRGTRRPDDLKLIEQAVEQREVLTRLRRAVPSTSSRTGS